MEYFFNFDKIAYLRGKRPEGCILCLVAADSEEVDRLVATQTDSFIVAMNLYPYNPGHLLVFPKRHILDIRELTEAESLELDRLTKRSIGVLERLYTPGGFNIGYNMGYAAGASIDHLHLHIIPRYPREIGISELIAGKRVLVEDPREGLAALQKAFAES